MIHKRGTLILKDSHFGSLGYFVNDNTEKIYYLKRISATDYDEGVKDGERKRKD